MHIIHSDIPYILDSVNKSERPDIKLFYLHRYGSQVREILSPVTPNEDTHANVFSFSTDFNPLDPFGIQEFALRRTEGTTLPTEKTLRWTLSQLLYIARLISTDERALWECIGPDFPFCFSAPLDSWTEQKAVKWVRTFLTYRRQTRRHDDTDNNTNKTDNDTDFNCATNNNTGNKCPNCGWEGEEKENVYINHLSLQDELDLHMQRFIKPDPLQPSVLPSIKQEQSITRSSLAAKESPASLVEHQSEETGAPTLPTASSSVETYTIPSSIEIVPMSGVQEGLIRCKAPLPSFSELLCVPHEALFCRDTVRQHSILGKAINATPALKDINLHEETLLVLCLIFERYVIGEARSHWRTLLEGCPSHYPFVPSFWELWDLAELEGLDMLDEVVERRSELHVFYERIVLAMPVLFSAVRACDASKKLRQDIKALTSLEAFTECFTEETLQWSRATFDSRAFYLNMNGETVLTLAPYADMINHCNKSDVLTRRILPNGDFSMEIGAALTTSDVGREVWMSYGPLQNWELLQYYGFVLDNNEHDKLPFPVQTCRQVAENMNRCCFPTAEKCSEQYDDENPHHDSEKEGHRDGNSSDNNNNDDDDMDTEVVAGATNREWEARRQEVIDKYFLYTLNRCWIGCVGKPSPALLALLRVMVANADELENMWDGTVDPFTRVSEQTEETIRATVLETVQCVLALFSTSLEEDEELLKEQQMDAEDNNDNNGNDDDEGEENYSVERYVLALKLRISLKRIAQRCLEWCSANNSPL